MKTIAVRAQFECMVQKDGETVGVLENDAQQVSIKVNNDFILTFFPLNNFECLPYSCKVHVSGAEVSVNTDRCAVVKLPYDCYDVVFHPYQLTYQEPIIELAQSINSPISNVQVKIIKQFGAQNWSQTLQIWEKNNNIFNHKLSSQVQSCKISSAYIDNEFFIIVSGFVDDYDYALFISANGKYQANLELLCHKIEIGEKEIKTLTKCFDINKHGKVRIYGIVNSQIIKVDEYIVSLKEDVKVLPQIVPFAFFESLGLGDLKLCRTYLTDALSEAVDDAHLKAYFGAFEEVRQSTSMCDKKAVVLIYKENEKYVGKLCKIEMVGDKIDNFELIDN